MEIPLPSLEAGTAPGTAPAVPRRPGLTAMWVGICLEFIEFAVFFSVYAVSRWHHPQDFQQGAARLWTGGGMLITGVMVTAGYALVRAVEAQRAGRDRSARRALMAALAIGGLYPVIKVLEWRWNLAHGIDASAGIFVVVYYYLTINHFVHACWGLVGMAWGLGRMRQGAYSAGNPRGLEALATYWHATDLVWLMIFALFYAYA